MEFGLAIPHTGGSASPEYVRSYCTAAEEAGFDSLWAVDHMVMPQHTDSKYTLGRQPAAIADDAVSNLLSPNYEMHTTLTWVAGFTSRIKLGTAVAVLPIRNPVANARQVATLDIYSGGSVLYGVGAGWLREEAEAMNMPWDRRGRRAEEHIALMRALWCADGDLVEFHGEFHDCPPMDPEPRPVQRPIPIIVGGHSDVALDRAGRIGDGWIAAMMSPPRLAEHWAKVKDAAVRNDRDPDSLLLVSSVPPSRRAGTGRCSARACCGGSRPLHHWSPGHDTGRDARRDPSGRRRGPAPTALARPQIVLGWPLRGRILAHVSTGAYGTTISHDVPLLLTMPVPPVC